MIKIIINSAQRELLMHDRETGLVYNNVYPDVDRKSALITPKTLVKTEDRPKSQIKTSRHKRKRLKALKM